MSQLAETGPAIVFTTTDRLRVAGVPVIVDMPLLSVQPVPVAPPAELVLEDAELSRRELSEAAAWRRELEQRPDGRVHRRGPGRRGSTSPRRGAGTGRDVGSAGTARGERVRSAAAVRPAEPAASVAGPTAGRRRDHRDHPRGPQMIKTFQLAGYEVRRFKGPLPSSALLFLVLLPVLFGALYLWSSWDPFGKTDQIPVAVVNEDVPVTTANGTTIDAGNRVVDESRTTRSTTGGSSTPTWPRGSRQR